MVKSIVVRGILVGSDIADAVASVKPYVDEFCQKFGVELLQILEDRDPTYGVRTSKPVFVFNDHLGGYTSKGVILSMYHLN